MSEQVPFGAAAEEFANNPEPRCPCVLLLDTSGSMQGQAIQDLNAGLVAYKEELAADSLAAKRVEVAVVTFGGTVQVMTDFQTAENFQPPTLTASGNTPMGEAILRGVDMVTQRKALYRTNGVAFYRPWIFLITDGGPTDSWNEAAERIKQGEHAKNFSFFSVGVEGANMDVLKQIAVREPLKLKGTRFRDLFQWLSNSQQSVSRSTPGDKVALPAPTGWTSV